MGLAEEKENRIVERKTPAEKSGITKNKCTLTELLSYKHFKIPTN
jgi:hypothetical protein